MTGLSLYLSPTLKQRLRWASKRNKLSVSKYAEQLLDEALKASEQEQLERVYEALENLKGIAKGGPKDLAQNHDKYLYGEDGAWRGSEPVSSKEVKKMRHE